MPLPRMRFTVRRIMGAVAAVAVLLGLYGGFLHLARRAEGFRRLAHVHADEEAFLREIIAISGEGASVDFFPGLALPSRRVTARAVADLHASLKWKYERAARFPWLPVAPDPPEPE